MTIAVSKYLPILCGRDLIPADAVAAFLVGSMARGWGHATSDVDVVVVTRSPVTTRDKQSIDVPLEPAVLPISVFEHEDRRWEVKFWLDGQVDQLIAKVSWASFEDESRVANNPLSEVEQLFLERLYSCAPLLGADWVELRREHVAKSAFRTMLITALLSRGDVTADAAMGMLESGETHGAVVAVKEAFDYVIDGLLVSVGEFGALAKWRPRRFRSARQELISFDEYWSIETMQELDQGNPAPWVEGVFVRCKGLASEIEL